MGRRARIAVASFTAVAGLLSACGGGSSGDQPFSLVVTPEFVQGVIPGALSGVLVSMTEDEPTGVPVIVTASADGATVTVSPPEIHSGEVAEVSLIAGATELERPLELIVTGRRGAIVHTVTRSTTVFPWEDDRGEYAGTLLDLFVSWLAENQPQLDITPATDFTGSFVAPGMLVVSHYCYMSDAWEIGLSWHIMVPPDDWAEVYLRPRGEASPTLAFRLASQAGAVNDGVIDVSPVLPPAEVVR